MSIYLYYYCRQKKTSRGNLCSKLLTGAFSVPLQFPSGRSLRFKRKNENYFEGEGGPAAQNGDCGGEMDRHHQTNRLQTARAGSRPARLNAEHEQ